MRILFPISVLVATVAASGPSFNITRTVPNVYIVKLSNATASTSSLSSRDDDAHSRFHKRADFAYKVRTEFTNRSLFYGLTIKMEEDLSLADAKAKILAVTDVVGVWPVHMLELPKPVTPITGNRNASTTKAFNRASSDVPAVPQFSGDIDVASALKMSKVDKLHALGIKGKGIKIGIIDSGVDYRHPALGGGFGPGFKVEGGYAFVQDDFYSWSEPIESPDPLITCFDGGHGTHVAGIIGGQDPEGTGVGLVGVAPEATLYMYRVFSCYGQTTEEVLLKAMQMAADDGVDIVSMSWGSLNPFELLDPFVDMTSGFANLGIAPIVAAGNDGDGGVYYISSPAAGRDVIAVGSVSNTQYPITYSAKDSRGRSFKYASIWPIKDTEPLDVFLLTVDAEYSCGYRGLETTYSSGIDWSKTVLVLGAQCLSGYWTAFNFSYVAYIDDFAPSSPFADVYWLDPVSDSAPNQLFLNINSKDSATILSMYEKAGGYGKYKWTFGNTQASSVKQDLTGGRMSNYSSFGPTMDTIEFKPQLSAPGGNILSTWPLGPLGGYTIVSGTSMATPFVAAAYALVKSQFPNLLVGEIRALLQTTSTPMGTTEDHTLLSSSVHQGSGLVNPFAAITYESSVFPGELAINDTDTYLSKPSEITITNKSSRSKTYVISHDGAGYVEYFPYGLEVRAFEGTPQFPIYSTAEFSASTIKVAAGESVTFSVTFTPPALTEDHPAKKNPIISGFIKIQNNNDIFTVPYAGLPYSRYDVQYFSDPAGVETVRADYPVHTVDEGFLAFNWSLYETPIQYFDLDFYTPEIRFDALPANTTFIANYNGPPAPADWTYLPSKSALNTVYFGVPTFGQLDAVVPADPWTWSNNYFPWAYSDIAEKWQWLGQGDYRILTSVLKFGGDREDRDAWEMYLGPVYRFYSATDCPVPNTPPGCYGVPEGPPPHS